MSDVKVVTKVTTSCIDYEDRNFEVIGVCASEDATKTLVTKTLEELKARDIRREEGEIRFYFGEGYDECSGILVVESHEVKA